jgi:hypothetical protein
MAPDELSEQLHLLEGHISQISEVISVLDDLPDQLDGHNRGRIEKLLIEFRRLLASSEALLKSLVE